MKQVLNPGVCYLLMAVVIFFTTCKKEKIVSIPTSSAPNQTPVNKPPVANAGTDQNIFLPLDTAELNGTASFDPDGSIIKFQWSKVSGDFSTISQTD
ncbi:MAG: hypothetical protein ABUT20_46095, partial [Bacteroidota bacterium]